MRTTFTSNTSFQDAAFKAKMAGFTPVGQARNPRGFFVVFAVKKDTVSTSRRIWW
jgi:hypothetical protein